MSRQRALGYARTLAVAAWVAGWALACTGGDVDALSVVGDLERDGVLSTDASTVAIDYASEGARAEWWPCDLRLTALGCVGEHHVNVYITRPNVTSLEDIGRDACVSGGVASGVYEVIDAGGEVEYTLGSDFLAFVLVASNTDDVAGADLASDDETTAASRLTSGTLRVTEFTNFDAPLALFINGETSTGNTVRIDFNGPTDSTSVSTLEAPTSCVESALIGGGL